MDATMSEWKAVRLDPIAEIFIACSCKAQLRLVDDRPTTCAQCGRLYVMNMSVTVREPVQP